MAVATGLTVPREFKTPVATGAKLLEGIEVAVATDLTVLPSDGRRLRRSDAQRMHAHGPDGVEHPARDVHQVTRAAERHFR